MLDELSGSVWRKNFPLITFNGDIKGISHSRMGMMKDRNGKGVTEAEEINKTWQEYTEGL